MKLQRSRLTGIAFAITICLTLCSGFYTSATGWEIKALQREIHARGYQWQAGKTSLSDLSSEERKSMLGLKPQEKIQMTPEVMRFALPYGQPTSFDWRNYNGENWVTPIKNQQKCGSCYAFGTLATMETLIRLSQSDPDLLIDLSEQYVVSCGPSGYRAGFDYGGCIGNYMDFACDFLVNTGAPDEACFPYDPVQQTGSEPACSNACADVAARVYKIGYSFIAGEVGYVPYPEDIKAIVISKPVPCGMLVYDDFFDYVGGIYQPVPEFGEEGGGHIVNIIGYNDSQSCWIVKNSWGTDWGETVNFTPYTPGAGDGGYFRVAYVTSANTLTWFGTDAVDINHGKTTTTIPGNINLKPYAPDGWSGPIVPSSIMGTNVFNKLCGGRPTYLDIAASNDGSYDITETFYVDIYIDGEKVANMESDGLPYGYYTYIEDWKFDPVVRAGKHTLKIIVDSENNVAESNEDDNEYEQTFTWGICLLWTSALYENILGENNQDDLMSLRDFRDEVLLSNQKGKKYVELLYAHSLEIALLLLESQDLSSQAAEVISKLQPGAKSLLEGEGMAISQELMDKIELLLEGFEAKASPGLRTTIERVKREIKQGDAFKQFGILLEQQKDH